MVCVYYLFTTYSDIKHIPFMFLRTDSQIFICNQLAYFISFLATSGCHLCTVSLIEHVQISHLLLIVSFLGYIPCSSVLPPHLGLS